MHNPYRILITGDMHLSSKNYGAHLNYPAETLEMFQFVTESLVQNDCGMLIGLGDLTYGRFHDLDYRLAIEHELDRQNELTNGNRYELKGNHDKLTSGTSEWEFYNKKGLLKNVPYIDTPCARLHLVNYGEELKELEIHPNKKNVVFGHNYFKYASTVLPNYGEAIILDDFKTWQHVDLIVTGHIHDIITCKGFIIGDGDNRKEIPVIYLGCPNRPSYRKEGLDTQGKFLVLDCSGPTLQVQEILFDLPDVEDVFLLTEPTNTKNEPLVDVSDIVRELVAHEQVINDPEAIIDSMSNCSNKVKQKAKELYREALA